MIDISPEQYTVLKKINKKSIVLVTKLDENQHQICDFLCQKGFLVVSKKKRVVILPETLIFSIYIQKHIPLRKRARLKFTLLNPLSTNGGFPLSFP